MQYLLFLLFSLIGFLSFKFLSHPNSSINKRLPTIKIKFIQIIPTVTITLGKTKIHLHHWLYSSVLLIISVTKGSGIFAHTLFKGFLVGSIFQGVTYPDWKKIVKKGV